MSAPTSSILAITFAIGVVLITAPAAPAGNCDVAKVRCSKRLLTCLLAVHQRAAREHEPVEQVSIDKCVERFAGTEDVTACIERVENRQDPARPDTICTRETDGSSTGFIAAAIRDFVGDLDASLRQVFEETARLMAGPIGSEVHELGSPNAIDDEVECYAFNRGAETKSVTVRLLDGSSKPLSVRVIDLDPGRGEAVRMGGLSSGICEFVFRGTASELIASAQGRNPTTGLVHARIPAQLPRSGVLVTEPLQQTYGNVWCTVVNPGWLSATTTLRLIDATTGVVDRTSDETLAPGAIAGFPSGPDDEGRSFFCQVEGTDPVLLTAHASRYDPSTDLFSWSYALGR